LIEIPGLLRELGADPADVVDAAGLDTIVLDSPESRIPYSAGGRLLHECVVKTGCQHFALLLGQRIRVAHVGLPGQLMQHSPTLGAALRTFVEYHHLNTQGMVKFLLEKDGVATFGCVIHQPGTEHVEQIYDLEVTATLGIMRELCGASWVPERVLFSHAKPANLAPYRRFFQTECRFDSERTALLFPAALLELRLPKADPKRIRDLQREAQARDDFGLVFRLKRSLRTLLLSQAASCDEVAKQLSMHRRTMERRLKSEGTTFQEVLDEVRSEAACQLLDTTGIPITEIAASLGYAETSAFTRAFRRWSGAAPLERRRRSQVVPSAKARSSDGIRTTS